MHWSLWSGAGRESTARPLPAPAEDGAAPWTDCTPPGRLGATGAGSGDDRLGWVDLPFGAAAELPAFAALRRELVSEGFERLVVAAMGGSAACPEMLVSGLPRRRAGLEPSFLNSLAPEAVREAVRPDRLPRTVFLVASKSGTTVETLALESEIVRAIGAAGGSPARQLLALGDPGSPLLRRAEAAGYRGRFEGKVNVGGRFSTLSAFGLLPAALAGCELREELGAVRRLRRTLDEAAGADEPAFRLGAFLARLAEAGRFQVHLSASPERQALLPWLEQLFAESTGKRGRGLLPVLLPPSPCPRGFGSAVLAIHLGATDEDDRARLSEAVAAGVPGIHCPADGGGLLRDIFRWQIVVAVAAYRLGVNPYDQPDVEGAKAAARCLAADPASVPEPPPVGDRERDRFLADAAAGGLVVNGFGHRSASAEASLRALQRQVAMRFGVVPAVGFGSALLHSLGQLEKGGPPGLRVLMLSWPPEQDRPIPRGAGLPASISRLGMAGFARLQAAADYEELIRRGRRVLWLDAALPGERGLRELLTGLGAPESG